MKFDAKEDVRDATDILRFYIDKSDNTHLIADSEVLLMLAVRMLATWDDVKTSDVNGFWEGFHSVVRLGANK